MDQNAKMLTFHVFLKLFFGDQVFPKTKNVDFSLVLQAFLETISAAQQGLALLAGTPWDPLKTLLESFSVPLLGN